MVRCGVGLLRVGAVLLLMGVVMEANALDRKTGTAPFDGGFNVGSVCVCVRRGVGVEMDVRLVFVVEVERAAEPGG